MHRVLQVGGAKVTLNRTGFEMGASSPLLDHWVRCYDGKHPLVDIGCAFGRNSQAALENLHFRLGPPTMTRVVAVDCDQRHLQAVKELGLSGLETIYGRLPDSLPASSTIGGGASGILISEVLHFLKGEDIEHSIRSVFELLVPGGKLIMSTVSFNFKPFGNEAARKEMSSVYHTNLERGAKWPGDRGLNLHELCKDEVEHASTPEERGAIERLPRYIHIIGPKELRQACVDAGFGIEMACLGDHPGYPAWFTEGQKGALESTHVVAVKRRPEVWTRGPVPYES